jgi:hypothetical protein
MKNLYTKLSIHQKSALPANSIHWIREKRIIETAQLQKDSRRLFYKINIKDF